MWSFLGNNIDTVILVAGVVGGWLGLTSRKRSAAEVATHVRHALTVAAAELVTDPNVYAKARRVLTDAARSALARLGVPSSKATDRLIELAITEVEAQLAERLLRVTLGKIADRADAVADTLAKASR